MGTARIGYGFKRTPKDFAAYDCEMLYLDGPLTKRSERAEMLQRGVRSGDTIVLLKISDLGAGKGLRNLRAELTARNVAIEVVEADEGPKKPIGRPPAWDAQAEADDRFRNLWHDLSVDGAYIIDEAAKVMNLPYETKQERERVRQRLQRKYGHRSKREAE